MNPILGVLWGFSGLTFGLAVPYLGMGVALGNCAAFDAFLPTILKIRDA